MSEPCGCPNRDGHAEPWVDPTLHLEHGERSALSGDPFPHEVPGTGGWNGFYTASPDTFCLCGHPNYLTCDAWPDGGLLGLTVHSVGGYILTTRTEER